MAGFACNLDAVLCDYDDGSHGGDGGVYDGDDDDDLVGIVVVGQSNAVRQCVDWHDGGDAVCVLWSHVQSDHDDTGNMKKSCCYYYRKVNSPELLSPAEELVYYCHQHHLNFEMMEDFYRRPKPCSRWSFARLRKLLYNLQADYYLVA